MSTQTVSNPETESERKLPPVGSSRRGRYGKLLHRFFEPLIFSHVLGPVRGERTIKRQDKSLRGIRRQFRDDLAFLCEYEKGGDACTAIGLQDRPDSFVYWVASNVDPARKIVDFLRSVLEELKRICHIQDNERQDAMEQLTSRCIMYAKAKVKKLKGLLRRGISECINRLKTHDSDVNAALANWFQQFNEAQDLVALCKLAYESRKSDAMEKIGLISQDTTYHKDADDIISPFSQVRHYVGRLADHIRVVRRLVKQLHGVQDLLEFNVEAIPVSRCVPRPLADSRTTLQGICNRLFRDPDDPRKRATEDALEEMDRKYDLLPKILEQYESPNFRPRVHAEVQVVEYFHNNNLIWADEDRYIGCSKPACFCCQLYLRYHPARPVEPQSHKKIYLKWGPPLLTYAFRDKGFVHQRDILNKMVEDLRNDLIEQIQEKRGPHKWHPDSHTAITTTTSTLSEPEKDVTRAISQDWSNFHLTESSEQGWSIYTYSKRRP